MIQHGDADVELRPTSSSIACMIEGTPAITITLPIQKPGAPRSPCGSATPLVVKTIAAAMPERISQRSLSPLADYTPLTNHLADAWRRGSDGETSIGGPSPEMRGRP